MGKVVRAIAGAAIAGIGVIIGNPQLALAGGNLFWTSVAAIALSPGQKAPRAQPTTAQIGEVARSGIFGKAAVAGSLVDAYNHGGKYGTDWTVLIIALADHRCEALEGFYVNDQYVAFAGDGMVAGYKEQLQVFWRPGTWDQAVPSYVLTTAPVFPAGHALAGQPTWTANDRGRGVSYVVVGYKADKSDAKDPVWTSGRPQFLWVVKGLQVYSARDDSTVAGGSGAHRWDDPETREWSDNLIDCRYTWARGIYAGDRVDEPDMLLLGRGLTAVEAPPEHVAFYANICDEPVALKAGGTEPRYRANGQWSADQEFVDVELMFASACGGVLIEREGSVEVEPGHAKSPVWSITDDDLVVGTQVTRRDVPTRTDNDWVNTVAARYIEPSQKYKLHGAPVRRSTADVIADKGPREATPALDLVTSGTQAQRVAEMARRLGRLWKRRSIVLPPRFAGVEHGDWLLWNSARYGGTMLMRVESDQLGREWRNTLSLRQVSADFADWNAALDELDDKSVAVNPDVPGGIGAPGAGAWSVALVGNTLVITGAADDDYASSITFEFASGSAPDPDVDDDWTLISTGGQTATRAELAGVAVDTDYYAAVSYVVDGERGDRLVLGPVSYASEDVPPGPVTFLSATPGVGEADIAWRNPTTSNFDYVVVYSATTTDFEDAVAVSGELRGGLGADGAFNHVVAAGVRSWWVQPFSDDDVPGAIAGPVTATVT
ncbi:phage tail protein [Sphingomonas sanxanigenens]|uniref:Tip attachment protein J domain-containing protein n=1 Tax=Sphingomonas sanxanigenens DSM 19645 = NX02 TaxID=1123269 RepID=W0AH89_9SPHN|nr:phage tail protein [Sphingomonas sanxanigenens]AHE55917.1 hypothetical protein NX02_21425 [Sphingomonas sanxanigenens DSM 19645 = NX02]